MKCQGTPRNQSLYISVPLRSKAPTPPPGVEPSRGRPGGYAKRDTRVGDLCKELGVTRQTLYRFVDPKGELRADGTKLLKRKGQSVSS